MCVWYGGVGCGEGALAHGRCADSPPTPPSPANPQTPADMAALAFREIARVCDEPWDVAALALTCRQHDGALRRHATCGCGMTYTIINKHCSYAMKGAAPIVAYMVRGRLGDSGRNAGRNQFSVIFMLGGPSLRGRHRQRVCHASKLRPASCTLPPTHHPSTHPSTHPPIHPPIRPSAPARTGPRVVHFGIRVFGQLPGSFRHICARARDGCRRSHALKKKKKTLKLSSRARMTCIWCSQV